MTWKHIRELAEAGERGEVIERRNKSGKWQPIEAHHFEVASYFEYRVKPKLLERWLVTGDIDGDSEDQVFDGPIGAENFSAKINHGKVYHLREVPDGDA